MPLPIIERRRIEAEIVGHLYRELVGRVGEQAARDIIDGAIRKAAIAHGEACRSDLGRMPDFKDFEAILPAWTADDTLTIDVKEARARNDFPTTSRAAGTPRHTRRWGLPRSARCSPAIETPPFAKAITRP